ncbi:hypothetical protein QTG95_07200 [Clostridium perfringens]|uniref:hypothetical protein n=1 Tax=Clostridium perfringens TaxID=1502 RepID=UPI002A234913|nr:hypothetical protein [Clostridium perfringens]
MRNKSSSKVLNIGIIVMFFICSLSFIGCSKNNEDNLKITEADSEVIREYIDNNTGNKIAVNEGEVYSAFKILGTSKDEIYLWVLKENSSGSASSLPVLLKASRVKEELSITDFRIPSDGDAYVDDVNEMFPRYVRKQIYSDINTHNDMINKLKKQINSLKNKR